MDKPTREHNDYHIRFAQEADIPAILGFIRALADYEHMSDQVVANSALLREWLFEKKKAEVLIGEECGVPVGFALFFHNFSTFLGRAGIYLEDLFVLPEKRGNGYGKALLERLAALTVSRGCGRLEWSCLDWNQPSIKFYRSMGATPMSEWTTYRLTGDTLRSIARQSASQRLEIRPLEEPLFEEYGRMHALTWRSAYRGILPDAFLAEEYTPEKRTAALREFWKARTNESFYLVYIDGAPGGMLAFCPTENPFVGDVKALYLLPEFQGQGFGRILMDRALAELKSLGCREAVLWVLEENQRARVFYEHCGFLADEGRQELTLGKPVLVVRYRRQIA